MPASRAATVLIAAAILAGPLYAGSILAGWPADPENANDFGSGTAYQRCTPAAIPPVL